MKQTITKRTILLILAFTVAFWGLAIYAVNLLSHSMVSEESHTQKEAQRLDISLARSQMEASIFMDIYLAESLAMVATIDSEFATKHWPQVAAKVINKSHFIRHVALAPNNIIRHIYPVKGNQSALGFDFRTQPAQLRTVELARENQQVFIAGPLQLVQGGEALIARFPIFSDYPINKQYWGSLSVVIDYQKLLAASGISELTNQQLGIRGRDGLGEFGDVFYGSETIFQQPDLLLPVKLPFGNWQIAMTYQLDNSAITAIKNQTRVIAVLVAVALFISLIALYRAYHFAHKASLQDELTRLPNRRFATKRLQELLSRQECPSFVLLNLDLNNFKQVNDEFGHEVGDQLLRHVAQLIQNSIRVYDFAARLGGDEFLIILHRVEEQQQLQTIITKIKSRISTTPLVIAGQAISAEASVGFAFVKREGDSVSDLMARADRSMYSDKKQQAQRVNKTVLSGDQES